MNGFKVLRQACGRLSPSDFVRELSDSLKAGYDQLSEEDQVQIDKIVEKMSGKIAGFGRLGALEVLFTVYLLMEFKHEDIYKTR